MLIDSIFRKLIEKTVVRVTYDSCWSRPLKILKPVDAYVGLSEL